MSQRGNGEKAQGMVAVAIDKDKGSQAALKWAVDNLLGKGKSVTFLHVKQKTPGSFTSDLDGVAKELFLPFRCFCSRKEIQVTEVVLEDTDVARAICDFVKSNLIENLVVGSSAQNGKFKSGDIPVSISKGAPDFCNVYAINKGKVASLRSAVAPLPTEFQYSKKSLSKSCMEQGSGTRGATMSPFAVAAKANTGEDLDSIKSPFTRNRVQQSKGELSSPDIDVSFISSGRSSCDHNSSPSDLETFMMPPRLSSSSDSESRTSSGSQFSNLLMSDPNYGMGVYSSSSLDGGRLSWSGSQAMDDAEGEIRRLKQELKQMMDMYSNACKEALTAKRKATELQRWKTEEQQRLEEAQLAKEAALATVEKEKQKCRAAIERAEAAERRAELEVQKRKQAEKKALQESEENRRLLNQFRHKDVRYRKYSIQELEAATNRFDESLKIGEGGYGPVFKCYLDHTPVAVKILHPDAAQGKSQFQQEVEVLSCIRHPNMVLLLGACPENGCLVYEYMANGSLDDRLFRRGNTPVLSWQLRFRIAAEIATGLLFLHQSKPEPLVHRDLKPANILLDYNFVSKISDVGLARLVPPSVADCVTQYHMTSAAGTFCYIDPEYQQTGMLGIKSDVYSLGVMLLQIITAKSPMGLTHHVERSIEKGTFSSMLDPEVTDWPVEEALQFARMALRCTELRRKDRPDLGTEVLPLLERLRGLAVAEGSISPCYVAKPESKYLDYSSNDSLRGVN